MSPVHSGIAEAGMDRGRISVRLFGTPDVRREADGSRVLSLLAQPKRIAVLAALALEGRGAEVPRGRILAALWPESTDSIPFDLMMRYDFVPEEQHGNRLSIVMADPTDVTRLDELELLLGRVIEAKVGPSYAIDEILRKSESAQRVLDEATEDFRIQLVK